MFRHLMLLIVIFLVGKVTLFAQYESSSPSIPKQEYFNPAFNAYKTYGSFNTMFRQQWVNSRANTPEMFAANIFFPSKKQGLGIGGTLVFENIGLRTISTVTGSLTKGIQLSEDSYLALGLGLGFEFESYQRSRMRAYSDVDFSNVKMNQSHPIVNLGMMALFRDYYFFGISSNIRINDKNLNFTYLSGFDAFIGRIIVLNPDYIFRTTVTGKYYKAARYGSSDAVTKDKFASPVIDWSISCLMFEQVWISLGLRFEQAVTGMVNYRISNKINLGIKYEAGIGTDYNRHNSQGVYLTYNFGKKKSLKYKGYNFYRGIFKRGKRFRNHLNEYLY